MRGTVSSWVAEADAQYSPSRYNCIGNPRKDVNREPNVKGLGLQTYGYLGRKDAPPECAVELIGLICFVLTHEFVPKRWLQVLEGRWVRFLQLNRAVSASPGK